ncbi:hypothetical protein [Salipiger mucosus]|uniref:Plastocyanin n=1 Tax=Salipiger mucosus DSM 16094 TaxID=1123237 RepID=S9Q381_9RHOB|nr:hypothetical protein [Salipiger mucosus]EPX75796.1 hypothetical protein Salmuc_05308 [Salipiger mucosus DSM 16094]
MLRKSGLLALALAGHAAPLHAEEHYVLMMGAGYFPDVVYPVVGDTVRFVNSGDAAMMATATDGSWTTGSLPPEAVYILPVTEGLTQEYTNGLSLESDSFVSGVIDHANRAPIELENNQ